MEDLTLFEPWTAALKGTDQSTGETKRGLVGRAWIEQLADQDFKYSYSWKSFKGTVERISAWSNLLKP